MCVSMCIGVCGVYVRVINKNKCPGIRVLPGRVLAYKGASEDARRVGYTD